MSFLDFLLNIFSFNYKTLVALLFAISAIGLPFCVIFSITEILIPEYPNKLKTFIIMLGYPIFMLLLLYSIYLEIYFL